MLNPKEDGRLVDLPGIDGLDMATTIDWYSQNQDRIIGMLPEPLDKAPRFELAGEELMSLERGEVAALIELFPEGVLKRSRLVRNRIQGNPTLYFKIGSNPNNPEVTSDASDAIGPTYIVPAGTDNTPWKETGEPISRVNLYQIPEFVSPQVRKIIHAESLVHEIAHTLLTPLYRKGELLKLKDGIIVNGKEHILEMVRIMKEHTAFSHYSSSVRSQDQELSDKRTIEEELSEAIAAYLLGFVFSEEEDRRMDPFKDRLELKQIIADFLDAESVSVPSEN